MTTTEELLTTMPSNTFAEITTSSAPAVITTQTTTQATSPTMKEQNVTTSLESTEAMTTTVSTAIQPDIDWEHINELDEQEVEKNTGLSMAILSSIVGSLIAIGSTIVCGVYQLCIPFNTTVYSKVTSVFS